MDFFKTFPILDELLDEVRDIRDRCRIVRRKRTKMTLGLRTKEAKRLRDMILERIKSELEKAILFNSYFLENSKKIPKFTKLSFGDLFNCLGFCKIFQNLYPYYPNFIQFSKTL